MNTQSRQRALALHLFSLAKANDYNAVARENLPRHVVALLSEMSRKEMVARDYERRASAAEAEVDQLMEALVTACEQM